MAKKPFSLKSLWRDEKWRALSPNLPFPVTDNYPLNILLPQQDESSDELLERFVKVLTELEQIFNTEKKRPFDGRKQQYSVEQVFDCMCEDIASLLENEFLRTALADNFRTVAKRFVDSEAPYIAALIATQIIAHGTAIHFLPDKETMIALNNAVYSNRPKSRDGFSSDTGTGYHNGDQIDRFIASHAHLMMLTLEAAELELPPKEQELIIAIYKNSISLEDWIKLSKPHFDMTLIPNNDVRPVLGDAIIERLEYFLDYSSDIDDSSDAIHNVIIEIPALAPRAQEFFWGMANWAIKRGKISTLEEIFDYIVTHMPDRLDPSFVAEAMNIAAQKDCGIDRLVQIAASDIQLHPALAEHINWALKKEAPRIAEASILAILKHAPSVLTLDALNGAVALLNDYNWSVDHILLATNAHPHLAKRTGLSPATWQATDKEQAANVVDDNQPLLPFGDMSWAKHPKLIRKP